MPAGKKEKNPKSKSQKTKESPNRISLEKSKKSSTKASASRHGTRSGLRSRPSAGSAAQFEDNPESILRKRRASQRPKEITSTQALREISPPVSSDYILETIETASLEEYDRVDQGASEGPLDEQSPDLLQETDLQELCYRKWGYVPPLSSETAAIVDAIIGNPDMAKELASIGPEKLDFDNGLLDRNVSLEESLDHDPQADYIESLTVSGSIEETDGEEESHGLLWTFDQAKCEEGSNEALFQRTLMMNLIARHHLIYNRGVTQEHVLDFSVEATWTCPPMPSRSVRMGGGLLTQSKPDLAVGFRRQAVIPSNLWKEMPMATKSLACYETVGQGRNARVFHFLTIEAKNADAPPNNIVALRQSLNNASQALHNMFAFCKDAGAEYEDQFFTKVRFFSVVASTNGIMIRIHRATREPPDGALIIPEYPLSFEYKVFFRLQKDNFDRKPVFETFKKIMVGYGATELFPLLRDAAKAIMKKLAKDPDGVVSRRSINFYRFGQTFSAKSSRRQTPAATPMSIDRTVTPTISSSQRPLKVSGTGRKRGREQSADDKPAKRHSQRKNALNT